MLTNDRLWVGTGNGVILSVPLVAARPARDDGETPTSSPGTGGSGGPGGAVRVYSNEGKDGDAPRGSSFMPYCSMVSKTQPGVSGSSFCDGSTAAAECSLCLGARLEIQRPRVEVSLQPLRL